MILLDTDHLTVLKYRIGDRSLRLTGRLAIAAADGETIGTTIVNVEEQMRGWMASIAKERQPRRQIQPYAELSRLFTFFQAFPIELFDEPAADLFATYSKIRISASDRKIAAITIVRDALLLTANRQDFEQIPGLRFENWLD